jgi:hypothetical protein
VRAWHIVRTRLRSLVFSDGRESELREADLNEELQLHLERDVERLQASGLSREDARLQALRLFGGLEQIKEASRDARGTTALDALARDTHYGLRRLLRDWRFTTAAVLILGLAIGANTAIFSLVNAVLFRPQRLAHPDRLVNIYQNDPTGKPLVVISYAAYQEIAEYKDVFAATMAASIPSPARYLKDGGIRVRDLSRRPWTPAVARPLVRRKRRTDRRSHRRRPGTPDVDQNVRCGPVGRRARDQD